jgi:hypothetical protein
MFYPSGPLLVLSCKMAALLPLLLLLPAFAGSISVPSSPPADAVAVSKYLSSFSIEFRDFVEFAGMPLTQPLHQI